MSLSWMTGKSAWSLCVYTPSGYVKSYRQHTGLPRAMLASPCLGCSRKRRVGTASVISSTHNHGINIRPCSIAGHREEVQVMLFLSNMCQSKHVLSPYAAHASKNTSPKPLLDSVDPKDDWTKMTDTNARRRAQNRLAQRNYRKSDSERKCLHWSRKLLNVTRQ